MMAEAQESPLMDDSLNVRFLIGAAWGGILSLLFWAGVLVLVRWL